MRRTSRPWAKLRKSRLAPTARHCLLSSAVGRSLTPPAAFGDIIGSVAREIEGKVRALSFERGYHPEFLGEYAARQASKNRLLALSALALLGILLLRVPSASGRDDRGDPREARDSYQDRSPKAHAFAARRFPRAAPGGADHREPAVRARQRSRGNPADRRRPLPRLARRLRHSPRHRRA